MSEPIQVSVRSSLQAIIDELEKVKEKANEVTGEMKGAGDSVEEGLHDNTKKVATFFGSLRSLSRRVADQLRGDFKSLVSINAVSESLKLSNQFKGTVSETVSLSDKIRKLGATFGIAKSNFASFQSFMTDGLGELGMSSEVATRVLEALANTPVRKQGALLDYSTQSGMLASVAGETGKEGAIAKGLANVTQSRGGDVNDSGQLSALTEAVRKVFVQTGAAPSQTLDAMEKMFRDMPKDLRKKIGAEGLANLAAVSAVGGPNATKFIEQYNTMSPVERMAIDAQGGGNLLSDKGLDLDKLGKFIDGAASRVGGDPRLGLKTVGIDPEAAEGLIRLRENMDQVKAAQERISKATGSLNQQYKDSMGFTEAFKANLNRVKKMISEPLATATQTATDVMSSASQSDLGAGAVAVGGGLLAAVLAGGGLKGIGKGLLGGAGGIVGTLAKKEGAETVLGAKTIPVYVVNASEIGTSLASKLPSFGDAIGNNGLAKGGGFLKGAGMVGLSAAVGVGIGELIRPYVEEWFAKKTDGALDHGGMKGDAIDRMMYSVDKALGGDASKELDAREGQAKRDKRVGQVRATAPDAPAKPMPGRSVLGTQLSPGVSEGQRELDGEGPRRVLVPTERVSSTNVKETTKTVRQESDSVKPPTPSAFPAQPTRVIVEMKDPRLKSKTKYPSQGASN